jgi:hypothetical protein
MEPVGVPTEKSVTVTIFLASNIPSSPVRFGLYDGGIIAAASLPGEDLRSRQSPNDPPSQFPPPLPVGSASVTGATLQFNFQAGQTLGLYRVLLVVPPKEYLLQFYAARPRTATPLPTPVAGVTPTPPPHETPPPS